MLHRFRNWMSGDRRKIRFSPADANLLSSFEFVKLFISLESLSPFALKTIFFCECEFSMATLQTIMNSTIASRSRSNSLLVYICKVPSAMYAYRCTIYCYVNHFKLNRIKRISLDINHKS